MHLPGGGLGITKHVAGPMQHQRHIGQVIGQQRGELGEAQGQQIVGKHHRGHAYGEGGFRQGR